MWNLLLAQHFCRSIVATAFRCGYTVGLSGGVLYRGSSANDLDIELTRRPQVPPAKTNLTLLMRRMTDQGWVCRAMENRIPFRQVLEYHMDGLGFKVQLIVMQLEMGAAAQRPFFGRPGRAEQIQAEMEALEVDFLPLPKELDPFTRLMDCRPPEVGHLPD